MIKVKFKINGIELIEIWDCDGVTESYAIKNINSEVLKKYPNATDIIALELFESLL